MKTFVKICGIKTPNEALSVLECKPDFIGVIFAKSKRQVDMQTAKEIANLAHKHGVKCVGVFATDEVKVDISTLSSKARNSKPLMSYAYGYETDDFDVPEFFSTSCVSKDGVQSDCEIMEICEYTSLDVAQIHGNVSENLYANLKDLGLDVWRALSVKDELINLNEPRDMVLYDCKGENLGGNGTSFEWEILKNLEPFSFGMAGGIGIENVKEALKFNPKIIDINSKVEDENGVKIPQKIANIIKILAE